jgi:enoyl-[acyl-carrier protein] reductase II
MEGDIVNGCFLCGQVAGMVTKHQPAAEIIIEIFNRAEQVLSEADRWTVN